jgi:hypothetical protein
MAIAAIPPPMPPAPPPPLPAHDLSAIHDVAHAGFLLAALTILFVVFRCRRERPRKDQYAGVTAIFGLVLCGRYAGHAENASDWIFVFMVSVMMIGLAYSSLGRDSVAYREVKGG